MVYDTTKPNAFVVSIVSISRRKGLVILGVDLVSLPRLYSTVRAAVFSR